MSEMLKLVPIGIMILLFTGGSLYGQVQVTIKSDKEAFMHAETFSIQAVIRMDHDVIPDIQLPDLQLSYEFDMEVIEVSDWEEKPHDALKVFERSWKIMPFDTGRVDIGPLVLPYQYFGQQDTAYSEVITVYIEAAIADHPDDFYPIKDIERVKIPSYQWIWMLFGLLLGMLIVWISWKWLKRKQSKPVIPNTPAVPEIHPLRKALASLEALTIQDHSGATGPEVFFTELTYILKEYIQGKTAAPAHRWTSEETLHYLQKALDRDGKLVLQQILQQSDLAKFALQIDYIAEKQRIILSTSRWMKRYDSALGKLDIDGSNTTTL